MNPSSFEHHLAHSSKSAIDAYMEKHPRSFDTAMKLLLANRQPLAWRAAWVVGNRMEENDARVKKHLAKLVKLLPGSPAGQQREILKIIRKMDAKSLEGRIFDHCVTIWEDVKKPSALRYYAIDILLDIAGKHGELQRELLHLLQPHYIDSLSPAIRKFVYRMAGNLQGAR